MNKKVNCIYNNSGAWCKCKLVKRSLFGFGARICSEFYGPPTCAFKIRNTNRPPEPQGIITKNT